MKVEEHDCWLEVHGKKEDGQRMSMRESFPAWSEDDRLS